MSAERAAPSGIAWWGDGGIVRREVAQQLGWLLIIIVVGFAVVWPVAQLQVRAFAEGGSAFARMMRIGDTIWTTVVLAVASSVLAVVLGTLLAWCASLLPRSVRRVGELAPLLPLIVPAAAALRDGSSCCRRRSAT